MSPVFLIILAVVVLAILWLVITFNGLVHARNRVHEGWSDIEVQLKRRHDLIPNLISTVQGYAAHEKDVFDRVTHARAQAMSATTPHDQAAAENMLSQTLKSLFAVSENYPTLQASQNFLDLQRDLTDAEDKIQAARRFYNGQVRDYNTRIQVFPNNLVAGRFGFTASEFFDAPDELVNPPKVSF
ncbi:LemA family protein [Candidatus Uhrbacteria bacterium]|nr:LemA family protein [Candidatus Uhrbacteria bacterium]